MYLYIFYIDIHYKKFYFFIVGGESLGFFLHECSRENTTYSTDF